MAEMPAAMLWRAAANTIRRYEFQRRKRWLALIFRLLRDDFSLLLPLMTEPLLLQI